MLDSNQHPVTVNCHARHDADDVTDVATVTEILTQSDAPSYARLRYPDGSVSDVEDFHLIVVVCPVCDSDDVTYTATSVTCSTCGLDEQTR
jgi:hypothetical protein